MDRSRRILERQVVRIHLQQGIRLAHKRSRGSLLRIHVHTHPPTARWINLEPRIFPVSLRCWSTSPSKITRSTISTTAGDPNGTVTTTIPRTRAASTAVTTVRRTCRAVIIPITTPTSKFDGNKTTLLLSPVQPNNRFHSI